jgi:hypothetical protein
LVRLLTASGREEENRQCREAPKQGGPGRTPPLARETAER